MRRAWFIVFAAALLFGGVHAKAAPYWCEPLRAYYPWVQTCPTPWREVGSQFGDRRVTIPPAQDSDNEAPRTQPAAATQGNSSPSPAPPLTRGDALDEWCTGTTSPLLTAICGDDELRALALQRLHAFDEAKARLSPDQQKVLIGDQNGWALSYPQACGLRTDVPPALPLASSLRECLAKAGRARLQYLKDYGPQNQQSAQNVAASPATPAPTPGTGPAGTQPPAAATPPANPAPAAAQNTQAPPKQTAANPPAATPAKPGSSDPELAPKPRPHPSLVAIGDFTRMGAMLIAVITVGLWIIGYMLRGRTRRVSKPPETHL